jgi:hypothetical protein
VVRVQTYATMQRKKADLAKQMAQTVFDISMDAQEGALYSVLDEMADQYIKEQMLAYFLLLKHKYPATEVQPAPYLPARSQCVPGLSGDRPSSTQPFPPYSCCPLSALDCKGVLDRVSLLLACCQTLVCFQYAMNASFSQSKPLREAQSAGRAR